LTAAGQGDIKQSGGEAGVIVEQLIKITHSVEQQCVRVLRLDAQVLLHHRGVSFFDFRARDGRHRLQFWSRL
jgi:hypothetical protein